MDPPDSLKKQLEEQIREESKAGKLAKLVHRHSTLVFSALAVLFIFSAFFIVNPEYTAQGLAAFVAALGKLHASLSVKRFSTYQVAGLIVFLGFMTLMSIESARARTIRIMSVRNPEHELYVRYKPLVGVKLPFLPESKKIRPNIIETEYGYIVYPSRSLLNAQWNGEKHFIPKHTRLSFGNTWAVAGRIPDTPTRIEKIETSKGPINVDMYEWEVDDIGSILAERAQKEIEALRNTIKTIEEQLNHGWDLANKIAAQPEEFFDKIKENERKRTIEVIDAVGSTVFREITQTIRQAYRYAQAADKRQNEELME